MSLQVWLPLTKDSKNQGLNNLTFTVTGATYQNTGGKLGGCYYFDGVDDRIWAHGFSMSNQTMSAACWVKMPEGSSTTAYIFSVNTTGGGSTNQIGIYTSGTTLALCSGGNEPSSGVSIPTNQWVHIVFTTNGISKKLYINGVIQAILTEGTTAQSGYNITLGARSSAEAGGGSGVSFLWKGYINDFRLYNHALSPLEVKHLAQGLVLHYPLNRGGLGPSNLLKNGFGEFGSENWSNSNIYTDVPSGHSEIKKSYRDNESLEFIPLLRNCTYKFSYWVKAAYSSGYSYPSLKPYDADKLFINTNNCREGFSLSTMTALKKQLNPGDTKIYVDDLSAWNANSGHYYDTVAIFSYTDGQGYTWPDGTYTRNCPAFSSGTEAKTNLDKTNNIITLLSAYTGPTMPIGTKVCASTYGGTFFYPSGGINNSTIADWTYKEGVFSSQHSRLECAKYIRVYAYSSCYQAGMILSNLTLEDMDNNIEYDCSGYGNNGTRVGTFSWSGDTPRYNTSTVFSGNQYIVEPNEIITTDSTIALWVKSSLSGNVHVLDARNNSEIGKQPIFQYTNGAIQTGGNAGYVTSNSGLLVANTWVHVVLVQNGNSLLIYKNGDLFQTISCANSPVIKPTLGARLNFANKYTGQISDFRIYATALSADDVMALYKNAGYVDSDGNVYAYEMAE